jgi:hypothetical protein
MCSKNSNASSWLLLFALQENFTQKYLSASYTKSQNK